MVMNTTKSFIVRSSMVCNHFGFTTILCISVFANPWSFCCCMDAHGKLTLVISLQGKKLFEYGSSLFGLRF